MPAKLHQWHLVLADRLTPADEGPSRQGSYLVQGASLDPSRDLSFGQMVLKDALPLGPPSCEGLV